MKRIFTKALCLVCAGALALSLAACGGKADSAASSTASSSTLGSAADYDYQNFNYSDGLDEKGYWEGIRALDYVTLPEDFASVAIKRSDVEPTSEEVEKQISDLLSRYSSTNHVTDRAAADGALRMAVGEDGHFCARTARRGAGRGENAAQHDALALRERLQHGCEKRFHTRSSILIVRMPSRLVCGR